MFLFFSKQKFREIAQQQQTFRDIIIQKQLPSPTGSIITPIKYFAFPLTIACLAFATSVHLTKIPTLPPQTTDDWPVVSNSSIKIPPDTDVLSKKILKTKSGDFWCGSGYNFCFWDVWMIIAACCPDEYPFCCWDREHCAIDLKHCPWFHQKLFKL